MCDFVLLANKRTIVPHDEVVTQRTQGVPRAIIDWTYHSQVLAGLVVPKSFELESVVSSPNPPNREGFGLIDQLSQFRIRPLSELLKLLPQYSLCFSFVHHHLSK